MPHYRPRIIDTELMSLMSRVPAVVIDGPKAVGKTATASQLAQTRYNLADLDERTIIAADRQRAMQAERPILIDEWQLEPGVWEAARTAVNEHPEPGMFVLTGSANPADARIHSGAGRFVRTRMRPLSLYERDISTTTVSFAGLAQPQAELTGTSPLGLTDYIHEIAVSGFPGIRFNPALDYETMMQSYVDTALMVDVPQLGFIPKRPHVLKSWFRAYAAAVSTTASFTAIADAMPEENRPTKVTVGDYREVLSQLWLLEQIPATVLGQNRLSELGKLPKHQLCDPAIAMAALGVTERSLLKSPDVHGPLLGRLFESLATLCVRVYAQASGMEVSHIRTARGEHEIDLIATNREGAMLAFEVKLGQTPQDSDVKHLRWLKNKLGDQVIDTIVLTTGTQAYRRPDGIGVVPLALLGP